MRRAVSIAVILVGCVVAACGGGDGGTPFTPPAGTPEPTATTSGANRTPSPAPDMLRIAYVNLTSPLTVDTENQVAAETYAQRLQIMIDELKEFDPDVVGVSEATWTTATGAQAWQALASGLQMEALFLRANPWFPGQDKEASDQTRELAGFEEGEALLSRYPILRGERIVLNPRTSENEGRIAAKFTVGIDGFGEVNVYVARMSGDVETRQDQAVNMSLNIEQTRGLAPTIVMADLGLPPDNYAVQLFSPGRYRDTAEAAEEGAELGTCCREQLLILPPGGPATPGLSPAPESSATPEATATAAPDEGPPPMERSLYVFVDRWLTLQHSLIGEEPVTLPDGSQLFASDHKGITAVISLEEPGIPAPQG